MTIGKLPFKFLKIFLLKLGFRLHETPERQSVFVHDAQDVVIALPPLTDDQPVPAAHLSGVRHILLERGLIEEYDYEALIGGDGAANSQAAPGVTQAAA